MTVLSRQREHQWHTPGLRARLLSVVQLGRDLLHIVHIGFAQLALRRMRGILDNAVDKLSKSHSSASDQRELPQSSTLS